MTSLDPTTFGDLAENRRRQTLIDRPEACAHFLSCLDSGSDGPCVFFLSAPGGTGKTVALRLFDALARERGIARTWIDARDVPVDARAAEQRFAEAVAALGPEGGVIFLDTFEVHQSLERHYRDRILPAAPKSVRVVLASRHVPDLRWRSDPAWDRLLRTYRLPLLTPAEADALLAARAVPEAERAELAMLARGHALTLACLATESPEARSRYRAGPHVLAELSDPLVGDERRALFVLCLVGWIDERDLTHAAGSAGFLPNLERHAFVERGWPFSGEPSVTTERTFSGIAHASARAIAPPSDQPTMLTLRLCRLCSSRTRSPSPRTMWSRGPTLKPSCHGYAS